jgi:hypothetical protein
VTPRLRILLARFAQPAAALARARRWSRLHDARPELAEDLLLLGGVALPIGANLDPQALAYAAGRRDLALELLALMQVTTTELNTLAAKD